MSKTLINAAIDLELENLSLQVTVQHLEKEARRTSLALKSAHSVLLENSMAATLEDGTPVLSIALAQTPELRKCYENVFLG